MVASTDSETRLPIFYNYFYVYKCFWFNMLPQSLGFMLRYRLIFLIAEQQKLSVIHSEGVKAFRTAFCNE